MESTGIEALDKILGGGLPRPSTILIKGPLGSGKSTLAQQIFVNLFKASYAAMYYAIDNSADDARNSLIEIGVDVAKYEQEKSLYFLDVFTRGVAKVQDSYMKKESGSSVLQSGLQFSDLIEMGRDFTLKNMGKKQVVLLDSFTPLLLMSDTREVFQYCQTLKYATRFANAIGIATYHTEVLDEKIENALLGFADGIIEMKKSGNVTSGPLIGNILVERMFNQPFLKGNFYYEIKNNKITISSIPGIV